MSYESIPRKQALRFTSELALYLVDKIEKKKSEHKIKREDIDLSVPAIINQRAELQAIKDDLTIVDDFMKILLAYNELQGAGELEHQLHQGGYFSSRTPPNYSDNCNVPHEVLKIFYHRTEAFKKAKADKYHA